jgi:predicted deacetylase
MPPTSNPASSKPGSEPIQALCVSVHDVAPHTWPLCERLLEAIAAVANIPVTLLVVPAYHHLPVIDRSGYDRLLEDRLARGDELALHGYAHLDEGPAPRTWRERFKRHVFTLNEGEFSAISASDAQHRLEMGLTWFGRHNWPVDGFVAPAWLLSDGAWQALRRFPFEYTTTLQRFYLLAENQALLSPSLVYSARNLWGRWTSRVWNSALVDAFGELPLVRLGLHPNDAKYPCLISHYQKLIEKLLATREPMTKAGFAKQWRASIACEEPPPIRPSSR